VATLCLVPTPLRASRMARRLCDAEGGLLFGPRVLTPDDLVPGLLAAGGETRPVLTPLAERILAAEAGRAAGGPFAHLSPSSGLARALAIAIAELRRGEVVAETLRQAASNLEGGAAARLAALAGALAGYESRLAERALLDRAAGLRAACDALRRGGSSPETAGLKLLVIDGFHALAPAALDLVSSLVQRSRRTLFRVPFFPERPDLSAPADPLARSVEGLHEMAAQREIEMAFPHLAGRAPRLASLLGAVAGGPGGAAPGEAAGRVIGLAASDEEGEREQAARLAARLLDEGFAPDDIAFLAPSPAQLGPRLQKACATHGVPLVCGMGAPLDVAPPVRAVRAALGAAPSMGRAAAEGIASSTYLGPPAPGRLGYWLDRAGALEGRGDPEELLRARAARLTAAGAAGERAALVRVADWLRELNGMLRPLGACEATARQRAGQLRGFVQARGVRRRAARAEAEAARRDLGALARLEECADAVAEALGMLGRGGERLEHAEWLALLDLALGSASVPVALEPAAGAAELWPLAEAPGLEARAAILLGCGRGTWTPGPGPQPVLRDPEREAVNRRLRRAAVATSSTRRAQAEYLGFCAMAAAREVLAFAWSAESGGPPLLVAEALAVAGAAPHVNGVEPALEAARSEEEALRAAARLGRRGRGVEAVAALAAVSPALAARATSAIERGRIEAERRERVLTRRSGTWAGGIPGSLLPVLRRLLPEEWSPSLLETWAGCPYRLFLGLALELPERKSAGVDIDPRDEGSLAHAVMERFLARRRARGAWPLSGGEEDRAEAREVAIELFASFEAAGRVGDPALWAARREAVLARIDRVVVAEARAHDGLTPELLEHRFGGSSGCPPLVFEDGLEVVRLEGRIDRVDADGERLLILDYKNARNRRERAAELSEEALGVTNFQMPAYVLAATQALPGRARLQAGYALLRSAERVTPWSVEAGHPFLTVDPARRAEAKARGGRIFADEVISAVRSIRRGEFPIASRDCTGCPYGAVCRFQAVAEAGP
jgi:hypothetical protein